MFDVFLFPSTCEGAAGAVFEAMASGLPIITTRNSGTPVVNGREGFIHAPDDIDGFIESIKLLQSDKELRLQMGVAAHQYVQQLTMTNYGRDLVRVFDSV
jgi:glycosyltransferase involved in cell wall biosynthesis